MTTEALPTALAAGWQPGLLDGVETSIDESFATARRIDLDATSWVEHVPAWLAGSASLFSTLLESACWEQRERWMFNRMVVEPRLTAGYDTIVGAPPLLVRVASALSDHYGVPYDGFWLNLYRDQRDSTSWHGDVPSCKRELCIVPVLSLGAPRRFLLRPRQGGPSVALSPVGGDLIVMGGRCQRDWQHCVPKQARSATPRISVNFKSELQAHPD
jgi:hypothetical protein